MARVGLQRHKKKYMYIVIRIQYIIYYTIFLNLTPFPLKLVGDTAFWLSYSDSTMSKL